MIEILCIPCLSWGECTVKTTQLQHFLQRWLHLHRSKHFRNLQNKDWKTRTVIGLQLDYLGLFGLTIWDSSESSSGYSWYSMTLWYIYIYYDSMIFHSPTVSRLAWLAWLGHSHDFLKLTLSEHGKKDYCPRGITISKVLFKGLRIQPPGQKQLWVQSNPPEAPSQARPLVMQPLTPMLSIIVN